MTAPATSPTRASAGAAEPGLIRHARVYLDVVRPNTRGPECAWTDERVQRWLDDRDIQSVAIVAAHRACRVGDLAAALRRLLALCESSLSPDSDAARSAFDAARAALAKAEGGARGL